MDGIELIELAVEIIKVINIKYEVISIKIILINNDNESDVAFYANESQQTVNLKCNKEETYMLYHFLIVILIMIIYEN